MENNSMVRKFKMIVCCLIIAFVGAVALAVVSFVQIGEARRANANIERQLEQIQRQKDELQKKYEALQSGDKLDEDAREEDKIGENENEIVIK